MCRLDFVLFGICGMYVVYNLCCTVYGAGMSFTVCVVRYIRQVFRINFVLFGVCGKYVVYACAVWFMWEVCPFVLYGICGRYVLYRLCCTVYATGMSFTSHGSGVIHTENGVVAISLGSSAALSFTYKLLYGNALQGEVSPQTIFSCSI